MAQKVTRGRARTPKAARNDYMLRPLDPHAVLLRVRWSVAIAFLPCSEPQLDQADHRDLLPGYEMSASSLHFSSRPPWPDRACRVAKATRFRQQ